MCEFCTKHGEGKKWYEVMEHYSQDLANEDRRKAFVERFVKNMRTGAAPNIARLDVLKKRVPFAYRFVRRIASRHMKRSHYGQVIPLEDAEQVIDMVNSITRIACVCRSVTLGKHDARYCLLLGLDPTGLVSSWPELEASLETISKEKAKALLKDFDQNGLVHSIWTFETPFIGAMCNCDHDCLAYKVQVHSDVLNVMFKSEYLAEVDKTRCIGCRNCQRLCQFGAVEYSVENKKCSINVHKCYGCGVCRGGCKKQALTLINKKPY